MLRSGYHVPFSSPPPLSVVPLPLPCYSPSSIEGMAFPEGVLSLISEGPVEMAPTSPGYFSHLFVVWTATGLWKTVVDLSLLSCFVPLRGSSWGPPNLSSVRCGGTSGCSPSSSRMLTDGFRSIPAAVVTFCFLRMNWCISSQPSPWPFRFFSQGHGSRVSLSSRPRRTDTQVSVPLISPRFFKSGGLVGPGQSSCSMLPS